MRFIVAQFQQESNSFSPMNAALDMFRSNCLVTGDGLFARFENKNTEMSGFLQTLKARGAEIIPSVAAGCVSGGPVKDDVFDYVLERLTLDIRAAGRVDCLLLCLHGAMLLESHWDGTGYFLEELRKRLPPDVLIAATLDFHANLTRKILDNADILVSYKTYPHVDLYETGCRAAELAIQTLEGIYRPVMRMRKLPMLLNSEVSMTGAYPMCRVMERAAAIERENGVLSVSVFQVQPWLNVEDTGCSCLVMTDGGGEQAQGHCDRLSDFYWSLRREFRLALTPLQQAIELAGNDTGDTPVILADSADGNGSGSPGDSPAILRELLRQGFKQRAYLSVVDPQAVQAAVDVGVGNTGCFQVGGKIDTLRYTPLQVTGRVKTLNDGRFVLKGPQSTGQLCEMGRTAVIQTDEIYIVLMENSVNNWDPSLYRSLGLEPLDARAVVVKSPAAFRAAYADISQKAYLVDAPGASSANFNTLPFNKIPRPMYPFDDFIERG